jgi:peptide deformylase
MIIIRKDLINIVDPASDIMRTPLQDFNFDEHAQAEIDMMVNVLTNKMVELGGVGLSANQVGLPYRVFVMGIKEYHGAFFNPRIIETIGEPQAFKEGCLSYPGLFMYIKRPDSVRVGYQNQRGEHRETTFSGLTARIFQHEYDHMEGRDFTMGASKLKMKMAKDRYEKKKKQLIRQHAIATMRKAIEDGHQENTKAV